MNAELLLGEIARFDRNGALKVVFDKFEDALDLTLVGLIVLAGYIQLPLGSQPHEEN